MAPLPQLHPGTVFARDFRALSLLATGGMGSVYVVEQISTGKRRALKIMQPQLVEDLRARQRFELEARIGGQIESEHVVEVVGAGVDDATGTPWLAMELLEGQDLASGLKARGRIPAAELHEMFLQLGDGLGAAHRKGIVHRDLKPENLFITVSRRRGIPFTLKILDFGIAKITQENKNTSKQTAAMGTPLWMAPEQTEQAELTPSTDVWALGLIAFNALTGRMYWRTANQAEVRLTALFTEVLVAPLDPPSVRAPQLGHVEPLPAGFDQWFLRCVARDRSLRFADGAAAIAALGPGFTYDVGRPHGVAPTQAARVVAPTAVLQAAQVPSSYPGAAHSPPGSYPGAAHSPPGSYPGAAHPPPGSYPGAAHPSGYPAAQPQSYPGAAHSPPGSYPGAAHSPPGGYVQPSSTGYVAPGTLPGGQMPSGPTPYTTSGAPPKPTGNSALRMVMALGGLALITMCAAGGSYGAFAGYTAYMDGRTAPPPPPAIADAGAATTVVTTLPDAGVLVAIEALPDAGPPPAGELVHSGTGTGTAPPEPDPDPEPAASPSDTPYRWDEGEVRRFRGTVRWPEGLAATFVLTLNRNGSNVAGFFDWTVSALDPGSTLYVGQHFNEGVDGTFSAPTLTLTGPPSAGGRVYNYRINGAGRLSGRDNEGGRCTGRVAR